MLKRIISLAVILFMLSALAPLALAEEAAPSAAAHSVRRELKTDVPNFKGPGMSITDHYSEHDIYKVYYFLLFDDGSGITNGQKINPDYDPVDPDTWYAVEYDEEEQAYYVYQGFTFWYEENGCWYLDWCNINSLDLYGQLDLQDCDHLEFLSCESNYIGDLNVSGCDNLTEIWCSHNWIDVLRISGCSSLQFLDCSYNCLSNPDVSNNSSLIYLDVAENFLGALTVSNSSALQYLFCDACALERLTVNNCPSLLQLSADSNELVSVRISGSDSLLYLSAENNLLTSMDVSHFTGLKYLDLNNNALSAVDLSANAELMAIGLLDNPLGEIDLSNCPLIPRNTIKAAGNGTVGYLYAEQYDEDGNTTAVYELAKARPLGDEHFIGWYGADGALLSAVPELALGSCTETELTARFGPAELLPGDADKNGVIDTADALIVLRAALGIEGDPQALLANCDMDGNGVIDTTDALMILRLALGIE